MRAKRLRHTVLACSLVVFGCLDGAVAEVPQPRYTAWQEIVLLTVEKVRHAAVNCGFRVDEGQVDAFLVSAALSKSDVDRQDVSPSLKRQIAADADTYLGDKGAACDQAWERYGPDGAPGIRNTLTR